MLKILGFITRVFLIFVIFIRVPEDSAGLAGFSSKTGFLGSPRSARRLIDLATAAAIIVYLIIALKLNLEST